MQRETASASTSMSRARYADVVRRAERTFSVMRSVIELPEGRLKAYRDDFYSLDRNHLRDKLAAGTFLWIVRETGTDLRPIGMSQTDHDWLRVVMDMSAARDVYLVDAQTETVTALSDEEAYALLDTLRYRLDDNGTVLKDGRPLASSLANVTWATGKQVSYADVHFTSLAECDDADRVALASIANMCAVRTGQAFFSIMRSMTLDGMDLVSMLTPALPALDAGVTWYGTVEVGREEHAFLRSLGVEPGAYDESRGLYPVRANHEAMQKLEAYANTLHVNMAALPHALKAEGEIELSRSLARVSDEHLPGYAAFLAYEASLKRPVEQALTALVNEQKRRTTRPVPLADQPPVSGASQPTYMA